MLTVCWLTDLQAGKERHKYKFHDGRAKSDISLAFLSVKRFGMEGKSSNGRCRKQIDGMKTKK